MPSKFLASLIVLPTGHQGSCKIFGTIRRAVRPLQDIKHLFNKQLLFVALYVYIHPQYVSEGSQYLFRDILIFFYFVYSAGPNYPCYKIKNYPNKA